MRKEIKAVVYRKGSWRTSAWVNSHAGEKNVVFLSAAPRPAKRYCSDMYSQCSPLLWW